MEDFIIGRDSRNQPLHLYDVVYTTDILGIRKYYMIAYDTRTFGFRAYDGDDDSYKTIISTNVFTKTSTLPNWYNAAMEMCKVEYRNAVLQKG